MPPDIAYARRRVEECRASVTVGFRKGLQSKEHRISDWKLYHDRAIEDVTPLVKALAKFKRFFFSSRRRHTSSVSAFLLNRSSDLLSQSADHSRFNHDFLIKD